MIRLCVLVACAFLSACGSAPRIQTEKFSVPKTVALVQPPAMRNIAVIGSPYYFDIHYTPMSDYCFILADSNTGNSIPGSSNDVGKAAAAAHVNGAINSGAAGQVVGGFVVGGIIDAIAADTQRKAEGFHGLVMEHIPDLDLRSEYSKALQTGLASKGIAVTLVEDSVGTPLRFRWPPGDTKLEPGYLTLDDRDLPTVDADLLVQFSPIAYYLAPGPLNNYRVRATVAVAVYNGRTKEFYGRKSFDFNPNAWENEYSTYSGLTNDIKRAIPALRAGLMAQVQPVVDVISKTADR